MFRLLLNISRNGHPVTSLSNLCQRSVTLIGRAFCVSVCTCCPWSCLWAPLKSLNASVNLCFRCVCTSVRFLWACPSSWTVPAVSASPHRRDILVPASSWPFSGLFPVALFLLHWRKIWTHYFRCYFFINSTIFLSLLVPLNHHQQQFSSPHWQRWAWSSTSEILFPAHRKNWEGSFSYPYAANGPEPCKGYKCNLLIFRGAQMPYEWQEGDSTHIFNIENYFHTPFPYFTYVGWSPYLVF